jgi:nucleotide-binding universal stress UspA family protein
VKINRLLVATDFSAAGNRAVQSAADFARHEAAALRIVHVVPSRRQLTGFWRTSTSALRGVQRQAALALKNLAETIDPARQLELSTGVITGHAAQKIVDAARLYDADLLAIGARGENEATRGQPGLGGTASKLVSSTRDPLWLVRTPPQRESRTVLAAVDMGELSLSIVRWAAHWAAGGRLHVLHAYEVPFAARLETYGFRTSTLDVYADGERDRLDAELAALIAEVRSNADPERIIERGDAVSQLSLQIDRLHPDLIVLGKHGVSAGRSSNSKFGSVCRYASAAAPTDVLIVPRPVVAPPAAIAGFD